MDSVTVVTRAPRRAACSASSPQPVPISSTWCRSLTPAASRMRSIFRSWADLQRSRLSASNKAEEYVIVSSRKVANRSLDRS